jgi:hypothetical protein
MVDPRVFICGNSVKKEKGNLAIWEGTDGSVLITMIIAGVGV